MAPAAISTRIALAIGARGGEPRGDEANLITAVRARAKLPRGTKWETAELRSHLVSALAPVVAYLIRCVDTNELTAMDESELGDAVYEILTPIMSQEELFGSLGL